MFKYISYVSGVKRSLSSFTSSLLVTLLNSSWKYRSSSKGCVDQSNGSTFPFSSRISAWSHSLNLTDLSNAAVVFCVASLSISSRVTRWTKVLDTTLQLGVRIQKDINEPVQWDTPNHLPSFVSPMLAFSLYQHQS